MGRADQAVRGSQFPTSRSSRRPSPYADYQTKVAAAIPAGEGPDVVPALLRLARPVHEGRAAAEAAGPMPSTRPDIDRDFFPIVRNMKIDGQYYALPTAVRSLALFWNKKALQGSRARPGEAARRPSTSWSRWHAS